MNASEKIKYASNKLMSYLEPYGYFSRYGKIWKCSLTGKFVISVSFSLTRWGELNEIGISYSSFYSPIDQSPYDKHNIVLNGFLPFISFLRAHGQGELTLNPLEPFEKTLDLILPYFDITVMPYMAIDDEFEHYLNCSQKLSELSMYVFKRPTYDINELCYAYLSIGKKEIALEKIDIYIKACSVFIQYIQKNHTNFYNDGEQEKNTWLANIDHANSLRQKVINEDVDVMIQTANIVYNSSMRACMDFFHLEHD